MGPRRSSIVVIAARPAPPPGAILVVVVNTPPPFPPRRLRLKLPEAQDQINGAAEEEQDAHDQATNLTGVIGSLPLRSTAKKATEQDEATESQTDDPGYQVSHRALRPPPAAAQ